MALPLSFADSVTTPLRSHPSSFVAVENVKMFYGPLASSLPLSRSIAAFPLFSSDSAAAAAAASSSSTYLILFDFLGEKHFPRRMCVFARVRVAENVDVSAPKRFSQLPSFLLLLLLLLNEHSCSPVT